MIRIWWSECSSLLALMLFPSNPVLLLLLLLLFVLVLVLVLVLAGLLSTDSDRRDLMLFLRGLSFMYKLYKLYKYDKCLEEGRYQYVSMMVICYASDVIEYDRRTSELAV